MCSLDCAGWNTADCRCHMTSVKTICSIHIQAAAYAVAWMFVWHNQRLAGEEAEGLAGGGAEGLAAGGAGGLAAEGVTEGLTAEGATEGLAGGGATAGPVF